MKKSGSCCIHSFLKICEKNLCNQCLDPWVSCSPELMTAGASPQTELITIVHVACLSYFLHVASSFVTFQPTWLQPFLMLLSSPLLHSPFHFSLFSVLFSWYFCHFYLLIFYYPFSIVPILSMSILSHLHLILHPFFDKNVLLILLDSPFPPCYALVPFLSYTVKKLAIFPSPALTFFTVYLFYCVLNFRSCLASVLISLVKNIWVKIYRLLLLLFLPPHFVFRSNFL